MSLYEQYRHENPRRFRVDPDTTLNPLENGNKEHPCKDCIVRDKRSPEHCDNCTVNPDRERLKRSGLL